MLEQEFGALEAFGELLADGLLDDARSREANERAGFGDVEVAEHGEAGGDAAGGRVGEHADVGQAEIVHLREAGGDLGQLHQADDALHHARAAGSGEDDKRAARLQAAVDGAGDGFADDRAHAATDEAVFHGADDDRMRADVADGVDDGVAESGLALSGDEAFAIGLAIDEVERVGGFEVAIDEGVTRLQQQRDALARTHLEVFATFGADVEVGVDVGFEEDLSAAVTLAPEALGADARLFAVGGTFHA